MGCAIGTEAAGRATTRSTRRYHACLCREVLEADPDLLPAVRAAGVTDIWMAAYFYGHWFNMPEQVALAAKRIEAAGLAAHVINVPLGHPGDSLGAKPGTVPLTPPGEWRPAMRPDGSWFTGTSLHPPATEENAAALRRIQAAGLRTVFLDDDFRLARSPGAIGGCFCDDHRRRFLQSGGYAEERWPELLDAVKRRSLTPLLRAWVNFTCDELTACFRAQQHAAPHVRLGNMVMFMGAEKAGIRLADYRGVPFRVGELMFDDASFGSVKAKTQELFSSLFHRRYALPDLAFSETTAFPADRLSAANMTAKLAVSTITDVRNTMFMSGMTPFPRTHWQTLGPAMKRHAAIHARLAGHAPRGPFKHYWGEHGRFVSDDKASSLFLAAGVPFEVTEQPAESGWTFLGDHDAHGAADGALRSRGTTFVHRPEAGVRIEGGRAMPETLEALFALKHEIADRLDSVPYVEQDVPVVCAWYPTAHAVLLWNLTEKREHLTVRYGAGRSEVDLAPLDVALVENIASREI